MGMASEKEIDCAAAKDLVTLFASDVSHGDNEIGAFATQRRGLFIQGGYRRKESQVSRVRRADAVVIGRAGEPDADAVDGHNGAILEVRQRLPIRAAQVGGIKRELGFGHPLRRKVALPKSNSWLPGTKMSGGIRLVSVMMCAP
jgi:hypothetical protein